MWTIQMVGKSYGQENQREERCLLLGKSRKHKGNDTADDHGDSQDQKLTESECTMVPEESSLLTSLKNAHFEMKNLIWMLLANLGHPGGGELGIKLRYAQIQKPFSSIYFHIYASGFCLLLQSLDPVALPFPILAAFCINSILGAFSLVGPGSSVPQ